MTNSSSTRSEGRSLTALASGALLIGFSPIFVRLSPVGPVTTGVYRLALALPFFLAVAAYRGRLGLLIPKTWLQVLPGVFFACDVAAWHWSIEYTSVANATLLGNLAPIFVTLVAWRFFQERLSRLFLVGAIIALAGTLLLLGSSFQISATSLTGDLLAVLTATFYGAYQLSINRLRRNFDTTTLMTHTSMVASVLLLAGALLSGEALTWSGAGWLQGLLALLGLAVLSQVCGQGMITFALKRLPVSFSSLSLLVQPVVAAIAAWFILGEGLGPLQLVGASIVLIGILMAQRGSLSGNAPKEGKHHERKTN
jgi:drug/metabolite transporter (DMT)-like permease